MTDFYKGMDELSTLVGEDTAEHPVVPDQIPTNANNDRPSI